MKRRGFLGLMGGAVAAGPAMAKQAVTGIEAMALPSIPWEGPVESLTGSTGMAIGGPSWDEGEWIKDRLAKLVGMTEGERKERLSSISVTNLDPDLAANRSFSLASKVAIQKRRNFDRQHDREHRGLLREMADYLKRQALS